MIPLLIGIPAALAVLFQIIRNEKVRGYIVYAGAGIIMLTTVIFIGTWIGDGAQTWMFYPETEMIDHLMTVGDIFLMCLIIYLSVKHGKVLPIILSVAQTALVIYTEFTAEVAEGPHMMVDWLTILMCVIIAFIGGFICIYTVGYMKGYHHHHKEVKDRQPFFFSMLFLFLAAMFGLVLSQNLVWIYFFWEITSVISFLMIGYTQSDEAVNNSFCALWMNLLGGLGFAVAIALMAQLHGTLQLLEVVNIGALLPLMCLSLAGMTKSAQLPFSTWLLGAMVAPTPSSALLHSATMVKAGVYLLIRISPALEGNLVGIIVSSIGGFTFIMASMMAIAQNDAKKVLAFLYDLQPGPDRCMFGHRCGGDSLGGCIPDGLPRGQQVHAVPVGGCHREYAGLQGYRGHARPDHPRAEAGLHHGHRHRRDVPGAFRNADLQVAGAEGFRGFGQCDPGALYCIRKCDDHVLLDEMAGQASVLPYPA